MKIFNQKVVIIIIALIVTFSIVLPALNCYAKETITDQMINAITNVNLPTGGEKPDTAAQKIVGKVINVFLSVFGIIFLALMIYGGYKWMMASGREDEVKKSKDIIRAAIIGLIIIVMAYAITYFISQALQNATK